MEALAGMDRDDSAMPAENEQGSHYAYLHGVPAVAHQSHKHAALSITGLNDWTCPKPSHMFVMTTDMGRRGRNGTKHPAAPVRKPARSTGQKLHAQGRRSGAMTTRSIPAVPPNHRRSNSALVPTLSFAE